jgi:hypothetical protein
MERGGERGAYNRCGHVVTVQGERVRGLASVLTSVVQHAYVRTPMLLGDGLIVEVCYRMITKASYATSGC